MHTTFRAPEDSRATLAVRAGGPGCVRNDHATARQMLCSFYTHLEHRRCRGPNALASSSTKSYGNVP